MVCAVKDAFGTDLQRIQIVKGCMDHEGVTHGQVYEVAGNPGNSDGVEVDVTEGTCNPVRAGYNELFRGACHRVAGGREAPSHDRWLDRGRGCVPVYEGGSLKYSISRAFRRSGASRGIQ